MAGGDKESDPQGMLVSPSHEEEELQRSPGRLQHANSITRGEDGSCEEAE